MLSPPSVGLTPLVISYSTVYRIWHLPGRRVCLPECPRTRYKKPRPDRPRRRLEAIYCVRCEVSQSENNKEPSHSTCLLSPKWAHGKVAVSRLCFLCASLCRLRQRLSHGSVGNSPVKRGKMGRPRKSENLDESHVMKVKKEQLAGHILVRYGST